MKTYKDAHKFTALILLSSVCMLVMAILITARSYADSDDSNTSGQVSQTGEGKKGFVKDIEDITVKNDDFRKVLYTAGHCQLVVMALKPKEEIGAETHKNSDQFFRVEKGSGEAVIDGVKTAIRAGFAVVVPAGANHNIVNTGNEPLKLYTIYAPPIHRDGIIHHTRAEAQADNERFDGKTTE